MMKLSAIILGGFLFISVSVGGGFALLVSKFFQHSNEGLALLCGGFLVGLLASDIIPSAFNMYELPALIIGGLIGYILFRIMYQLLHSSSQNKPTIYLLLIGLFIHTIPLSLTIGNLSPDASFGVTITTSTILHHLPEGFALTSAFLSQGEKLWGLFLCFIGLSVCFSGFIWLGHLVHLTSRGQGVLIGVSISLIAFTSVKEFILHHIRVIPMRSVVTFTMTGYLLSILFHLVH